MSVHKARADGSIEGNKNFGSAPDRVGKRACFQNLSLVYDQLLPKCEPTIIVVFIHFYYVRL